MSYTSRSVSALTVGFVALLLGAFLPLPVPSAISSQPWKVEALTGAFLSLSGLLWMRQPVTRNMTSESPRLIVVPVMLFVGWSALSAVWADFPALTVHHALVWAAYAVILCFLYSLLRADVGVTVITTAFTITALVIGVVCAIDYLTLIDFASIEGSIRQRYAKFAEMLITIVPVLWIVPLYVRRKRAFWLSLLVANLGWIAVMLSLSKGAFLAGIGAFIVLFAGLVLFTNRGSRKLVLRFAALWLAVTLVVQAFFTLLSPAPSTTDYLTGYAGNAALSSQIRVLTWRIARTMAMQHPVLGVGADNFGIAVNGARRSLPQTAEPQREVAEDLALERAHNEPLQVLAELGIIGLVLFLLPFIAFGILVIRRMIRNRRLSPMLWAAIAGMMAFFASSLVSSFSFRAMQNGIAFTMVFAIGIYELTKRSKAQSETAPARTVRIASILLGIVMIGWFGVKAISEYYIHRAEAADDIQAAGPHYRTALALDPYNANARLAMGARAARQGRHGDAVGSIRDAIDRGLGVTLTYALLAKEQRLAGDLDAAERAFAEGLRTFPGSVYLRVDHALFLESVGRASEADDEMRLARAIDLRQANGWYALIRDGSTAAFYRAQRDLETAPPAELWPTNAVRQYLDE